VHEAGVVWRVVKRTRFRPSKVIEVDVVIDNLSVTGAGVLSPADTFVKLGQVVDLRLGRHWGQVRVLHCRATDDPAVRYWGVEFLDNDNAFAAELSRRLAIYSSVHGEQMRDWDGD
jgi:hypothetical protein